MTERVTAVGGAAAKGMGGVCMRACVCVGGWVGWGGGALDVQLDVAYKSRFQPSNYLPTKCERKRKNINVK